MKRIRPMSPSRLIALCFLSIILIGAILLWLPISHNEGVSVSLLDALFTSTSATCVTGLIVMDTAESFSIFGRAVILALIQIGGIGAATIGIGVTLLAGKRLSMYYRNVLQESWNIGDMSHGRNIYKSIILITVGIELAGALVSIPIFMQWYSLSDAVGISLFHSISSFNNAGFDLMGNNMSGLVTHGDNVALNLVTITLIILGGIGYLVMIDLIKRKNFRKLVLQTKIVLFSTAFLIVSGMIMLLLVEDMSPLEALFQSVTTRTAGFATVDLSAMSNAGLLVMCIFMFIGASPGSTGGGVKTSTIFVAVIGMWSTATNRKRQVFRRAIADSDVMKAFVVLLMAAMVVIVSTFALVLAEPETDFILLLFEAISAFATVGLSAGLTPELSEISRIILIITMYIGRLGPITIATVWFYRNNADISYTTEHITIG